MVQIGNFFFKTRNFLFPVFYVLLFLPFPRITQDYILIFCIGLGITFIGQLIRMLTIGMVYIIRGGKNRRIYAEGLVTEGLFSHSRNPMYVGNVSMIIGMSILSNSVFAIPVMIPLFIFIYQAIIRAEENFLRDKFGTAFDEYCTAVNRWFPKLKGIVDTFKKNDFDTKKVFFKEYNTTFIWMLGATLLFAYNKYFYSFNTLTFSDSIPFIIVIATLTILYFTIRYFKKRKNNIKKK
ncbi:isoprenylcysteine carboxylmethyltransferase family protein [Bernardetia sp. Wsw4-3y2]|uniref:methyltransferase family protein n=1 Tax=Bernardetia sp. Wsw4-3y2 TaxID=3127471 RepID=UPI0030D43C6A